MTGTPASPDRIVLTMGAQHALLVALMATVKPGDTVLTEELTYSGMKDLGAQLHVKFRGIAMDAEGMRVDALEAACRSTKARILYCMPRLQNPTSAVMSERRRRQKTSDGLSERASPRRWWGRSKSRPATRIRPARRSSG